ncbi:aldose epimerase family protein [Francisella sp. 19X1-34]|uniref:aldose epimerase family protein n=1 Tax=Francisella sp. 19X1-34 TaxID=3087177 RepID=UPI002E373B93|nr:aldose epimerase family protein [Francisella sp. 19X1-34]MED7788948.1 aldose epimerase family protein [Francisella sp. 19X1-34]
MSIKEVCIANKTYNLITLKNDNVEVTLLDLGAVIYSLKTKDKNGKLENIVLQYQDIEEYSNNPSYFGATVGRVAGRIKDAKITLNDKTYELEKNYQDKHTLHGGFNCITHQKFDFQIISNSKVKFTTIQKSSVDKFPGNVTINVTYELLDNSLIINFDAISDADTVLNMTNHCHYNLSGNYKTTIVDHELEVPATKFVNVDDDLIPTEIISLPKEMDFNKKSKIGDKLDMQDSKYFRKGGIDHCYIVDGSITLENKASGRKLKVSSSYPAMQIYTCNFSRGHTLSNGDVLKQYDAICFEPQYVGAFDGNYDNHPAKLIKDQEYRHFIKLDF